MGEQNKSNAMAIAKSEATFTKQIDQIGVLITTLQKGLDEKIDDVRFALERSKATKKARATWGASCSRRSASRSASRVWLSRWLR